MNTIYYFTGTGNSLQVAGDIAKMLGDTEIRKIADYNSEQIGGETLGIIFPVYNWGLPLVVVDFLNKLHVADSVYIYAAATYGALAGKALDQCKTMLAEKSRKLSAGFYVNMPGNNITFSSALDKDKQKPIFNDENKKIKMIVTVIKGRKVSEIEKGNAMSRMMHNLLYKTMIAPTHGKDKKYTVSEGCSGCGICAERCQVKNIRIKDGKPEWQHHCEMCLACIQSCPNKAIDFGGKTKDRVRYLNPNVDLGE